MKNKPLLAALIGIVLFVAGSVWYAGSRGQFVPDQSSAPQPIEHGPSQTYVSKALGVQFQYIPQANTGGTIAVTEEGQRIYVHDSSIAPQDGQFVEVFSKNADETFAQSIQRQILSGYSAADCKVEVSPSNIQGGFQVAEISYPHPADTSKPWYANASMCNEQYDQTNGIRYFLYNPAFPDKFAFVDAGQYAIFGHDQIPWQYTFTFTN